MAGGRHVIGAVLTLRDNMSSTLRGVRREQSDFRRDVESTRRALDRTFRQRREARLNTTAAHRAITRLNTAIAPLRRRIVTAVAYRDLATRHINRVKNELKALGRRVFSPVIKIKDNISSVMKKISGVGKAVGGVALAAAGGAGIGMLKSGAELEQQQVAMGHFIGINNKGKSQNDVNKIRDSFLKDLRENSNATPFTSSEVIAAGTRALGVASGSTKEAMELVKVAEDMAALTPGKSVSDAMEALADAKNGEMERLKEFNAKVSAEEFEKLGFKGVVNQKLKSQFSGGAEKLSTTGMGLVSTIKGKLSSKAQDTGLKMLEKSKPLLQNIIKIIDSPGFNNFGKKLGDGLRTAGTHISSTATMIGEKFSWISTKTGFLKDVWKTSWSAIGEVINTVKPLIEPIWGIISNGCKIVFEGFQLAFPYIKSNVSSVWDFVSPIFDKLGGALSWVSDKVSGVAEWIGGKVNKSGNAPSPVNGSHATGLKSVPFDGYIAELHKGEAVIPARMNPFTSKVNSQSQPIINININGTNKSTNEIVNELVPQLKSALLNI